MLDPPDGFTASTHRYIPEMFRNQQQQQQQEEVNNDNHYLLDQYLKSYLPNQKKGNKIGKNR